MHKLIRNYNNNNNPIININNNILLLSYFNFIKLQKGQVYTLKLNKYETVWVVQKGNCFIQVDDDKYENVGKRKDIWSGKADSVYAGCNSNIKVIANIDDTEIAIAGGFCETSYNSFRILPEEVSMVDVGSVETHTHRRIFHILGHNGNGRSGNLLVSELYCDDGCWSGYPPHKHDTENAPHETEFEEIYHYRFNPENGFGGQYIYTDEKNPACFMTKNGDTFAFNSGYHPTVTSPGHREYIFTILTGKFQRSLIQNFKEEYRYLMNQFPGINAMREQFK